MGTKLPQKGAQPPCFAHVYCGQRAGCISIPLNTEVGLGLDDIVLDGGPAAPKGAPPQSSAHVYCSQTVAHLS